MHQKQPPANVAVSVWTGSILGMTSARTDRRRLQSPTIAVAVIVSMVSESNTLFLCAAFFLTVDVSGLGGGVWMDTASFLEEERRKEGTKVFTLSTLCRVSVLPEHVHWRAVGGRLGECQRSKGQSAGDSSNPTPFQRLPPRHELTQGEKVNRIRREGGPIVPREVYESAC